VWYRQEQMVRRPKLDFLLKIILNHLMDCLRLISVFAFDKAEIGITGRLSIDTGTDYNELSNRPRTSLIFPVATQDLDRAFCVAQDVARRINQDGEFHREFLPPAKALRHASLARMQLNNMTRGLRMWMQPR
jgi:hypothetical protein